MHRARTATEAAAIPGFSGPPPLKESEPPPPHRPDAKGRAEVD
ncbi:MAG: hypothetical protein ACTTJV_06715 [Ottowia sp.]